MPSPSPQHQDVVTELATLLRVFAKSNDLGKVFTAPLDTTFDEINTFQPDLLFIKKDRRAAHKRRSSVSKTQYIQGD